MKYIKQFEKFNNMVYRPWFPTCVEIIEDRLVNFIDDDNVTAFTSDDGFIYLKIELDSKIPRVLSESELDDILSIMFKHII